MSAKLIEVVVGVKILPLESGVRVEHKARES